MALTVVVALPLSAVTDVAASRRALKNFIVSAVIICRRVELLVGHEERPPIAGLL